MPDIPAKLKANIPSGVLLDAPNNVAVRINSERRDIDVIKENYSGRLFNVEIEDDIFLDSDVIKALRGVRLRIESSSRVFEIGRNIDLYREAIPVFGADADEDLIKKINYLTGLGFQVHINTNIPPVSEDILIQALEFYLHNPLLRTPIDPFHTILKTMSSGGGYNLWDTEYEKIDADVYITDNNDVTLSERWARRGLVYGKLDSSWTELSSSKIYQSLVSYKKDLFKEKGDCVFCSHMDICGGFLKAADREWPCGSWIKAFDFMRREISRAKDLLKEHNKD